MTIYLEEGINTVNVIVKDNGFFEICDTYAGDFNNDYNNDFSIFAPSTYNYLMSLKYSGSTELYYCYIYDNEVSPKYMNFQISVTGSSTASTTASVVPYIEGQWRYKIYPNEDFNFNDLVDPLDVGILYIK